MKRTIFISALIAFFSIPLIAQPEFGGGPNPFGKRQMMDRLNLSPEQQKQVATINTEHQKKMVDLKAQIEKNQIEIKKMFIDKNIDEKKLLDITDANSKIQSQIKNSAVKKWLDIYKLLNDEQKEIWTKHFVMMGAQMKGMKNTIKHRFQDRPRMQREFHRRNMR